MSSVSLAHEFKYFKEDRDDVDVDAESTNHVVIEGQFETLATDDKLDIEDEVEAVKDYEDRAQEGLPPGSEAHEDAEEEQEHDGAPKHKEQAAEHCEVGLGRHCVDRQRDCHACGHRRSHNH